MRLWSRQDVRRPSSGCAARLCTVILIGSSISPTDAFTITYDNPCPEGWYQDLSDDGLQCREQVFDPSLLSSRLLEELDEIHIDADRVLDRTRRTIGFEIERFDSEFGAVASSVYEVSACTEEALQIALDQLGNGGGGRVELPACRIRLTGALRIPAQTILAGQGKRSTVLVFEGDDAIPWGGVLRIEEVSNVIVRDIGIERSYPSRGGDLGVAIYMADNVLLERLSVSGVRVGFWGYHSTNFTIRYSDIRDLAKSAGDRKPIKALSFGECDQAGGSTATTASCEATRGFQLANKMPTASMWTAGFAFYSNHISGTAAWGSSSASVGEIAGNRYEFGSGQLKIVDGRCVLVHHNAISNIYGFVVFRAATEISDRGTRWLGFYENRLEDNSNPGRSLLNLTTGEHVYLLNNRYRNNTGRIVLRPHRGKSLEVFTCPFGEEARPRDTSAHEGLSPHIRILEDYDRLCAADGGRYLFHD